MHIARPIYFLGVASATSTLAATVLNAIYSTSKYSSPNTRSISLAAVGLSALGCIGVVILLLISDRNVKAGLQQWERWKIPVYYSVAIYLVITAGVAMGAMAWNIAQSFRDSISPSSTRANSLLISHSVVLAISVFVQGLFCGFLLPSLTQREYSNEWPHSMSQELERLRGSPSLRRNTSSASPSFNYESRRHSLSNTPKASSDKLTPIQSCVSSASTRFSRRYSGRTLIQQDSRHNSLEWTSPAIPSIEKTQSPCKGLETSRDGRDTSTPSSTVPDDHNSVQKPQRSHSVIKASLDSLMLGSLPSPTITVSSEPASPRSSLPRLNLSNESNIHPLFRKDSPSSPPTPTLGTVVTASPAAGQTITVKTLNKMRSNNSLRVNTPRARSPLLERVANSDNIEQKSPKPGTGDITASMPRIILAADLRKSLLRYEQKYDLRESPHES